ncbi:hypothetical protein DMC30DRAFT_389246 [Rhodotorula diobovata]|uniref:Uncharacterized protein n=1 Tax=Rhodotorula diobovata TaxID=5288 RepID=A0A5C5G567_9BASI|nr:hypothetical protein DMC30DRAFT_389246 [Rhodotorula diobovata]
MANPLTPWLTREWLSHCNQHGTALPRQPSLDKKRLRLITATGISHDPGDPLLWCEMTDGECWIDCCVPTSVVDAFNATTSRSFVTSSSSKCLFRLDSWLFVLASPLVPARSSPSKRPPNAPSPQRKSPRVCLRVEALERHSVGTGDYADCLAFRDAPREGADEAERVRAMWVRRVEQELGEGARKEGDKATAEEVAYAADLPADPVRRPTSTSASKPGAAPAPPRLPFTAAAATGAPTPAAVSAQEQHPPQLALPPRPAKRPRPSWPAGDTPVRLDWAGARGLLDGAEAGRAGGDGGMAKGKGKERAGGEGRAAQDQAQAGPAATAPTTRAIAPPPAPAPAPALKPAPQPAKASTSRASNSMDVKLDWAATQGLLLPNPGPAAKGKERAQGEGRAAPLGQAHAGPSAAAATTRAIASPPAPAPAPAPARTPDPQPAKPSNSRPSNSMGVKLDWAGAQGLLLPAFDRPAKRAKVAHGRALVHAGASAATDSTYAAPPPPAGAAGGNQTPASAAAPSTLVVSSTRPAPTAAHSPPVPRAGTQQVQPPRGSGSGAPRRGEDREGAAAGAGSGDGDEAVARRRRERERLLGARLLPFAAAVADSSNEGPRSGSGAKAPAEGTTSKGGAARGGGGKKRAREGSPEHAPAAATLRAAGPPRPTAALTTGTPSQGKRAQPAPIPAPAPAAAAAAPPRELSPALSILSQAGSPPELDDDGDAAGRASPRASSSPVGTSPARPQRELEAATAQPRSTQQAPSQTRDAVRAAPVGVAKARLPKPPAQDAAPQPVPLAPALPSHVPPPPLSYSRKEASGAKRRRLPPIPFEVWDFAAWLRSEGIEGIEVPLEERVG